MRKLLLAFISLAFIFSGILACGSTTISISPAGPVTVQKSATQQFTSNIGVTWAVTGGDSNGTISSDGLFTPPSTLPINPEITITASSGGETASAIVNLRTANSVTFTSSPQQINTDSILYSLLTFPLTSNVGDALGVRLVDSSLLMSNVWVGGASGFQTLFNDALNLTTFSSAQTLFSSANASVAGITHVDSDGHMMVISSNAPLLGDPVYLFFTSSSDNGTTFSSPQRIDTDNTYYQQFPFSRLDADNNIHLVYTKSTSINAGGTNYYVRSNDGGQTWSTPVRLGSATSTQAYSNLAVDATGETIYVSWTEDQGVITNSDLLFTISTNGGQSFSSPTVFNDSHTIFNSRLALDTSNNILYLLYQNATNILVQSSTNGGSSFNSAVTLNSSAANIYSRPMIAIDSLGRVDVVWDAYSGSGSSSFDVIYHARSTDQGTSFSAQSSIAGATDQLIAPLGLTHDISGRLHIQYLLDTNPGASAPYNIIYNYAE